MGIRCRFCSTEIDVQAKVCRYCGKTQPENIVDKMIKSGAKNLVGSICGTINEANANAERKAQIVDISKEMAKNIGESFADDEIDVAYFFDYNEFNNYIEKTVLVNSLKSILEDIEKEELYDELLPLTLKALKKFLSSNGYSKKEFTLEEKNFGLEKKVASDNGSKKLIDQIKDNKTVDDFYSSSHFRDYITSQSLELAEEIATNEIKKPLWVHTLQIRMYNQTISTLEKDGFTQADFRKSFKEKLSKLNENKNTFIQTTITGENFPLVSEFSSYAEYNLKVKNITNDFVEEICEKLHLEPKSHQPSKNEVLEKILKGKRKLGYSISDFYKAGVEPKPFLYKIAPPVYTFFVEQGSKVKYGVISVLVLVLIGIFLWGINWGLDALLYAEKNNYIVNATSLRIRQASNSDAKIIGALEQNDTVNVLDISGGWAKVSFNGIKGWTALEYLVKIDLNNNSQPSQESSPTTQTTSIEGTITEINTQGETYRIYTIQTSTGQEYVGHSSDLNSSTGLHRIYYSDENIKIEYHINANSGMKEATAIYSL